MTTRDTILSLLRSGPKTSWELTEGAKTSRYGGRIMELRRIGYDIQHSIRSFKRTDGEAIVHHVYELISEPTIESIMRETVIKPLIKKVQGEKVRSYNFKQGKLF